MIKMARKINPSWERTDDKIFSPPGIESLRESVKYGLTKKYYGLAQSRFKWSFGSDFDDCVVMSKGLQPERSLFESGEAVIFRDPATDQCHILPLTYEGGINIYGNFTQWHPVPVGWSEMKTPSYGDAVGRLMSLKLDAENSVIIRNDRFGTGDKAFIDSMISELTECILTDNQLILLSRMPLIFSVDQDNLLTAKKIYLNLSKGEPVIYKNNLGENVEYTSPTGVKIDTGLFELFDRFECQILDYLGTSCVPITKRAQQSVAEVESNSDKISLRLQEYFAERERACERVKEVLSAELNVENVIDLKEKEVNMDAYDNMDLEESQDKGE